MTIELMLDGLAMTAELNDSPIAKALAARLPLTTSMSRWGDEYYGAISVGMHNDPQTTVDVPRAASPVTVLGALTECDTASLRALGDSVRVTIAARGR